MGRVISTLNQAQREGHCHALLESPTGTGKSLSLLCSSLAWQQHYKSIQHHLKPAPEATTDPLAYGGGFVPEELSLSSGERTHKFLKWFANCGKLHTGCQWLNAHKVKCHPSLQKGGCNEVHDIEDLVKVGQLVKGCSYYAARSMSDDAQLVFCPYNYIINPVIRAAMDVDIKGAVVILDEAQ
ncbi:unnamed protein product [Sphenostylis stenocarpa]|uniref:Helicase ATP-binding domain-containing protein n=1 Tax=Sphenostylis stenocarpa TaxID=92480 RepID=A0AA86VLM0_9FABA|nr:unnamed protein product [Sphenostylis stenocarpa]